MRQTTSQQADTGWATQGSCHEMIGKSSAFFGHVLHGQRRIAQRIELEILIIRHDKEKVGLRPFIGTG